MNLFLLKQFNNYYNRKIVKHDSLEDYLDYENVSMLNINFVPNDGITTEQIINWNKDWTPDYLLCVNENNEIDSR